jgi:hypothetical protein
VANRYSLRASDSDREDVAERLRAATVEGRLQVAELEQRLEVAFRARTYGELDALVADLPVTQVPVPAPVPARRRPGLPVLAGGTLALGLILSALDAAVTSGYARFHAGVEGRSASVHGSADHLYHGGPAGLLGVAAPLIVIVFLVVVCAGVGWLFSQSSDAGHTAPNA